MAISTYLRFRDLKQRQIVTSWPQLGRLIRDQGFPRGSMLGANTRAWPEEEIVAWLDSRPQGSAVRTGEEREVR
jgi:predicted DNA-binding transcriptional regulator AlpA